MFWPLSRLLQWVTTLQPINSILRTFMLTNIFTCIPCRMWFSEVKVSQNIHLQLLFKLTSTGLNGEYCNGYNLLFVLFTLAVNVFSHTIRWFYYIYVLWFSEKMQCPDIITRIDINIYVYFRYTFRVRK